MSSQKEFDKFLRKANKQVKYGMVRTINECMFTLRKYSLTGGFNKLFVIRSVSNLRKHLWIQKARKGTVIAGVFGTTQGPRFTGFKEQQHGTSSIRRKTATPHARGGSLYGKKKIAPRFRTKPGNKSIMRKESFPKGGKSSVNVKRKSYFGKGQMASMFLAIMQREGYSGPAIITDHATMPDGVYQIYKNAKPKLVQSFKKLQPARKNWAEPLVLGWRSRYSPQEIFNKEMKKIMKWK